MRLIDINLFITLIKYFYCTLDNNEKILRDIIFIDKQCIIWIICNLCMAFNTIKLMFIQERKRRM